MQEDKLHLFNCMGVDIKRVKAPENTFNCCNFSPHETLSSSASTPSKNQIISCKSLLQKLIKTAPKVLA